MADMQKTGLGFGQLKPVVLLLAAAVVLPTVCLLWFMGLAMKNERLAVRQKLIDFYSNKADDISSNFDKSFQNIIAKNNKSIDHLRDNPGLFLNYHPQSDRIKGDADRIVIIDTNGSSIYPFKEKPTEPVFERKEKWLD